MTIKLLSASLLLAVSIPALAQTTPASGAASNDPAITPKNGQSSDQIGRDRYDCYVWAKQQSGFDPAQSSGGGTGPDLYRRAFTACMSGRGYALSYATPPGGASSTTAAPPVAPAPSRPFMVRQYGWEAPTLVYRPVHVAIEGGPTATTGSTNDTLNDGANVGLGVSFFPVESLPVGLRVDGSWSRFDARYAYFNSSGDAYTHAHENIYGGDVDLQFNLPSPSARYRFYLLGGAGWYREQQVVDQFQNGCGYYYCGPAFGGSASSTTGWRSSWNVGVGGEVALPQGTSFFVEARYQEIAPHDSDMQFVPIRVGLRF
jgi:hypothetical protein